MERITCNLTRMLEKRCKEFCKVGPTSPVQGCDLRKINGLVSEVGTTAYCSYGCGPDAGSVLLLTGTTKNLEVLV